MREGLVERMSRGKLEKKLRAFFLNRLIGIRFAKTAILVEYMKDNKREIEIGMPYELSRSLDSIIIGPYIEYQTPVLFHRKAIPKDYYKRRKIIPINKILGFKPVSFEHIYIFDY